MPFQMSCTRLKPACPVCGAASVAIAASPAAQSARNWYVPAIDKARGETRGPF